MNPDMQVKKVIEQVIEVPALGSRIKEARQQHKLSLIKLCEQAHISRKYWYDIEAESLKHPLPLETLREIEKALGVSFDVMDSD